MEAFVRNWPTILEGEEIVCILIWNEVVIAFEKLFGKLDYRKNINSMGNIIYFFKCEMAIVVYVTECS